MEPCKRNPEEFLLDFHLDRLSERDRSWIEAKLRSDAELRAESERLGQVLRPLDHWTVQPAPSNLVNKVLADVERAERLKHVSVPPATQDRSSGRSFSLPLREILAVAACIALLCGLLVPGIADARDRARRALCASNLGSICQGTHLYQQAFGGSLAR